MTGLRAVVVMSREMAQRSLTADAEVHNLVREDNILVDEVDDLVRKREEGVGLSRFEDVGP